MSYQKISTTCCIVGGGPAGMMAGFLLARAGIDVFVLEKHKDFFRDFRGDTIHPSTFQLMHELDLLQEFLKVPHQEILEIGVQFNNRLLKFADFSHLPVAKPAMGLMPQWDFLNFLQSQAIKYGNFHLLMEANATELIKENEKIVGITAITPDGAKDVYASLVIIANGRDSELREKAGLKVTGFGVPIDVLWFRLSKLATDPVQALGYFQAGKLMVLLDRNNYWQCGYIISKGGFMGVKERGLASLREEISGIVPFIKDRTGEITEWEQVKLLTVEVDRLEKWYCDGLLCIGDAAHAMSPVGGVGINLALQDAVAAANILYHPLKAITDGNGTHSDLKKFCKQIQKRRMFPTKMTQRLQLAIQRGLINEKFKNNKKARPPFFIRLCDKWPLLRRLPARLVGLGVRPEHIKIPKSG